MNDATVNALFSIPENDALTQRSWRQFQRGAASADAHLRRIVSDSWTRCQQARVDPSRDQAPITVIERDVLAMQLRHRDLLEAGKPVMSLARDYLSETGTVMVLADPSGAVLDVEGDARTLGPAERIHLLPGAVWNEVHCGTNAIGTALSLEQPVQIHSEEHYCEGIKRWTCSAAVIRHPHTRSVLGVLDISGLSRTYNRQSLSLVVNSASRIETFLAQNELLLRYNLLEQCIGRLATRDGCVVLDRHGFAIKFNEHAGEALAALGADFDLHVATRIEALGNAGAIAGRGRAMPDWLRDEWIEPILQDGRRIGSVIRLPTRPSPQAACAPPAAGRPSCAQTFSDAIGQAATFRAAVAKAVKLARSRAPVLLLGETGTGKEVFARGIHQASTAKDGPFVALNCGGLSRDLLASELFGYREGAFTGSRRGGMAGKIEAADRGTLFLDEIGEMPLDLQPHFLRVLEDGQIFRLGDSRPQKIGFRLLAATNRDLRAEVAAGRFRMDLYYRISVTSLRLPPLRERPEDIALLADHFLGQLCEHHGTGRRRLDLDLLAQLQAYAWPGNVRELRNVIESMILTAADECITLDELPLDLLVDGAPAANVPGAARLATLERMELEQIQRALARSRGNATLAAQQLGIAKSTLYVKLKKYGLEAYLETTRH